MKNTVLAILVVVCTMFTGCGLISVHEHYLEEDIVVDDRMLGEWKFIDKAENDGQMILSVTRKEEEKQYTFHFLETVEDGKTSSSVLVGTLFKIRDVLMLDTIWQDEYDEGGVYDRLHQLPIHRMGKLQFDDKGFQYFMLSEDVEDLVDKKYQVKCDDSTLMMTLTAEQWKNVLSKHITEESLFENNDIFRFQKLR